MLQFKEKNDERLEWVNASYLGKLSEKENKERVSSPKNGLMEKTETSELKKENIPTSYFF